jgi:hypothetical protein
MFFKNMPPLMTVQNFIFDKKENNTALNNSIKYEGKVELEIYGQNISTKDIEEIGKALGQKCFGNEEVLSPSLAISIISKSKQTEQIKDGSYSNVSRSGDLKAILENIEKEYTEGNNYKKTIRLFEVYRMLNE